MEKRNDVGQEPASPLHQHRPGVFSPSIGAHPARWDHTQLFGFICILLRFKNKTTRAARSPTTKHSCEQPQRFAVPPAACRSQCRPTKEGPSPRFSRCFAAWRDGSVIHLSPSGGSRQRPALPNNGPHCTDSSRRSSYRRGSPVYQRLSVPCMYSTSHLACMHNVCSSTPSLLLPGALVTRIVSVGAGNAEGSGGWFCSQPRERERHAEKGPCENTT